MKQAKDKPWTNLQREELPDRLLPEKAALDRYHEGEEQWTGSVETLGPATDKYDIANFARDDWPRFIELVNLLSPRDSEIMLLFAVLQKRPTDLSVLFGKAGHRAEEDLHKAAHKLAGLIMFGPQPEIAALDAILVRHSLETFGNHSLAACLSHYASTRDFTETARLIGQPGLRQHMLRTFKLLHRADGRDEGLLAGWILWLVDGSDPRGKGWIKRKRVGKLYKMGPTVFKSFGSGVEQLQSARPASQRGGRGQRTSNVKIQRKMKFILRGMND